MRLATRAAACAAAVLLTAGMALAASPAQAAEPLAARYRFKNCTQLHKYYKHGVGKLHAHDRTSGTPVTNFKRSTKLYKKIVGYRPGLDRDHDGIACEKH